MSVLQTGNMVYRNFGNSGLKVSAISLGNMINHRAETYEQDKEIIALALKNGINHFDTAEIYTSGEAELQLGRILKDLQVPREQVVIATKVRTAKDPDINSSDSTNRKHVRESVEKSLKRLQLDYVDIIYAHLQDQITPVEEVCRAFHEVVERGQAFYWATSNWRAQTVFKALGICERLNLHKPIGAQNEYSMLVRQENQIEYDSLFNKYNYGLIAWSPLCGGFLTGRYIEGLKEDDLNRFTDKTSSFPIQLTKQLFYTPYNNEKTVNSLIELRKIADQIGCKLIHLALAWVIKYPHADSALIGARTVQHLQDSLGALAILDKFTEELQKRINKILDNSPTPRFNFKGWKPFDPVRPVAKE